MNLPNKKIRKTLDGQSKKYNFAVHIRQVHMFSSPASPSKLFTNDPI